MPAASYSQSYNWSLCPTRFLVTFSDIISRMSRVRVRKTPYQEHGKPGIAPRQEALNFGIQLEHACGGKLCLHHLPRAHENRRRRSTSRRWMTTKLDRVETAGDLTLESRLGCQAVVTGDVVVAMPAWNRNYVSEGGGSMNLGDAIPVAKK